MHTSRRDARTGSEERQLTPPRVEFSSIHDPIAKQFHLLLHEMEATEFRETKSLAMKTWRAIAQIGVA